MNCFLTKCLTCNPELELYARHLTMLLVIMLSDNQHWYCPMLVIILSDNRPSKSVVIEEYDLVYPGKVADG